MRDSPTSREIEEFLAKQELHELTARYCRGIDRADEAILLSVWHTDATVDYGFMKGSAKEFSQMMTAMNEQIVRTIHCVSNELFEVDGKFATGESYLFSISTRRIDGKEMDTLVGGRYLDRFELRDGEWRLLHRTFIMDWNMNQPSTGEWSGDGRFGVLTNHGRRDKSDPVYSLLGKH
jgi:hypothetical protein